MQDILAKHWGKAISTIVGLIATVSVAYTTIQTTAVKVEKMEMWKTAHEIETARFMGQVIAQLESIDQTLKRIDK
jgi:hypothetical protein